MVAILLLFGCVVVFFVAIASPKAADKTKRKTQHKVGWLKSLADWFWNPVSFVVIGGLEFSRKSILRIADWGKRVRAKLPF